MPPHLPPADQDLPVDLAVVHHRERAEHADSGHRPRCQLRAAELHAVRKILQEQIRSENTEVADVLRWIDEVAAAWLHSPELRELYLGCK